jgi:hypothetical protein
MLQVNAAAVLQIDEEIQRTRGAESEERIRELRGRRNRLVPLGQLPPELLGRILYHTLWRDSRPAIYKTVQVQDIYRHEWVESTLACRHVRAVALRTPELWMVIADRLDENGARWATLCAERAGAGPLTIISFVDCEQNATSSLSDSIWTAAGAIEMPGVWSPKQIDGGLNRPLPRLRHLQLNSNGPLPAWFLTGSSTSLTSLSLTFPSLFVPHAVVYPRFPALLHFAIKHRYGATHTQEVLALLDMLGHTPRLQTLQIDNGDGTVFASLPSDVPPPHITLPHLHMLSLVGCASMLMVMVRILPKPSRSLAMHYQGNSARVDDEVLAYVHAFWMEAAPHSSLPGAQVRYMGHLLHFQIGVPLQKVVSCPPHVYFAGVLDTSKWLPFPCPIGELHLWTVQCTFDMAALGEEGAKIRKMSIRCAKAMGALPRDLETWVRQRAAEQNHLGELVVLPDCGDEVRDHALRWEADGVVSRAVCTHYVPM